MLSKCPSTRAFTVTKLNARTAPMPERKIGTSWRCATVVVTGMTGGGRCGAAAVPGGPQKYQPIGAAEISVAANNSHTVRRNMIAPLSFDGCPATLPVMNVIWMPFEFDVCREPHGHDAPLSLRQFYYTSDFGGSPSHRPI